jgi:hypothetical protein
MPSLMQSRKATQHALGQPTQGGDRWTIADWGLTSPPIVCVTCDVSMELRPAVFTDEGAGQDHQVRIPVCPRCGDTAGSCDQATAWKEKQRMSSARITKSANS